MGHDIERCRFFNREENCIGDNMFNARPVGRRPANEKRRFMEHEANNEPTAG